MSTACFWEEATPCPRNNKVPCLALGTWWWAALSPACLCAFLLCHCPAGPKRAQQQTSKCGSWDWLRVTPWPPRTCTILSQHEREMAQLCYHNCTGTWQHTSASLNTSGNLLIVGIKTERKILMRFIKFWWG